MRKEKLEELKYYIEELKTIEKTKEERLANFIKGEVYKCHLNNGQIIMREKLLKGNKTGSAAIILPMLENKEVILIVEPRVFTKRTVGVGLPAGYIEPNELPNVAALRELQEETGYVPNKLISLGGFYQDMGCSSAFNESFLALDCKKISEQNLDHDEFIRYFKCYFDEALELMELGYIEGANSIITLEKVKKLGGF